MRLSKVNRIANIFAAKVEIPFVDIQIQEHKEMSISSKHKMIMATFVCTETDAETALGYRSDMDRGHD